MHGAGNRSIPKVELNVTEEKCLQKHVGSGFCIKVENYPENDIDEVLEKISSPFLRTYFSEFDETDQYSEGEAPGAGKSRLPQIPGEPLCQSIREYLHPQAFVNQKGILKKIVNTNQFRQSVRVQKCT